MKGIGSAFLLAVLFVLFCFGIRMILIDIVHRRAHRQECMSKGDTYYFDYDNDVCIAGRVPLSGGK